MAENKATAATTDENVTTPATDEKPAAKKGTQLSTVVSDEALLSDLSVLRRRFDLATPSDLVRYALVHAVETNADEIKRTREFFNITD